MSLRLGFDVDGVLADFRTAFLDTAKQVLGKASAVPRDADALPAADVRQVWEFIAGRPNWWMGVRPCEPAQIVRLYQLSRRFRWEVVFMTRRLASAGDSVQFQTQAWIEAHGFYMPAVVTVPGSRGDLANALHLDLVVDDLIVNCAETIAASRAKAILLLRRPDPETTRQAAEHGIGVVGTLEETIDVLAHLQEIQPGRGGLLTALADWFLKRGPGGHVLPMNPRAARPVPPPDGEAG